MRIERMQSGQAPQAAALHYEGQRHTFLGQMGEPFLVALYYELVESPWGFGLVALEGDLVIGVATATRNVRSLFRDLIWRRGWYLLGPVLTALWRSPSLIPNAFETLAYPRKVGHLERGEFEFLFLGIHRDWRGAGVGNRLMDALIEECRARGCRVFDSLVEEANSVSNHLHIKRGFSIKKKIVLFGRPMTLYTLRLDPEE